MNSAISLFDLGGDLIRLHERSAPGYVTVIPVLVDDLVRAKPIFEALCHATEGRIFSADDDELQTAVLRTHDRVRRTAVETALVDVAGGRRVVLINPDLDSIDAQYDPPTGTSPSPGEAAVLAIARAVMHRELDDRELAVILYSESGIDYALRKCVWRLIVDQLPDLPHPTLRTLIFVTETNIDIGLHCETGRGFRLAISGDRLLRRRQKDDLYVFARQIARHPGPVVFFLGAGFSASSRLPLGNALRDASIRRLMPGSDLLTSDELAIRFYRWVSGRDNWLNEAEREMREDEYVRQLTLEQVIRAEKRFYPDLPTLQEFRTQHDDVIRTPGQAVIDLSYVVEQMVGRVVVVEVNFDCLVERHTRVPVRVLYSDDQFTDGAEFVHNYLAGAETDVPVLKLHGSLDDIETCVASDEQTLRGIGEGKLETLRALVAGRRPLWVYVGASMRDRDLLPVFSSPEFANALDERWVSPYLDAAVEEFAKRRVPVWSSSDLKSIEERVITETADAFFGALRRELP